MQTTDPERDPNFILHWLNNNEMHFSMQAENILQELHRKMGEKEEECHKAHDHESEHDDHSLRKKPASRSSKQISQEESGSDHVPHSVTLSAATSINSLATDSGPVGHVPDSLDTKIDCLLRDWHHSPDLLYSIHPVDGSYLIW